MTSTNRYHLIHFLQPCQTYNKRYIGNTRLARELICVCATVQ